jgi:hypothetical protein
MAVRGSIVLVDPDNGRRLRVIPFQYNPETLSRTLAVQGVGTESGPHVDQMRLKGPPVETIKLDAELDATDRLEHPDQNPDTVKYGIAPDIAALETIVYPSIVQLADADARSRRGILEIIPMDAPLPLFVWGASKIVPVRITEFSVAEEFFDDRLNPIRAKVSMGLRVLSIDDLQYASTGGSFYLAYQRQKETLAKIASGSAGALLAS